MDLAVAVLEDGQEQGRLELAEGVLARREHGVGVRRAAGVDARPAGLGRNLERQLALLDKARRVAVVDGEVKGMVVACGVILAAETAVVFDDWGRSVWNVRGALGGHAPPWRLRSSRLKVVA